MENGMFDLLGRIRCRFNGISRDINFIMRGEHGYIEWAK
jgi:hypothetical protein